jgi:hypothetical protein
MDPLSITASAIAVGQALQAFGNLAIRIKDLKNAPSEVNALSNEILDIQVVLKEISLMAQDLQDAPEDRIRDLAKSIKASQDKALEVDSLLRYEIIRPGELDHDGRTSVSKFAWARKKAKAERMQRELRELRQDIILHLALINTWVAFLLTCWQNHWLNYSGFLHRGYI